MKSNMNERYRFQEICRKNYDISIYDSVRQQMQNNPVKPVTSKYCTIPRKELFPIRTNFVPDKRIESNARRNLFSEEIKNIQSEEDSDDKRRETEDSEFEKFIKSSKKRKSKCMIFSSDEDKHEDDNEVNWQEFNTNSCPTFNINEIKNEPSKRSSTQENLDSGTEKLFRVDEMSSRKNKGLSEEPPMKRAKRDEKLPKEIKNVHLEEEVTLTVQQLKRKLKRINKKFLKVKRENIDLEKRLQNYKDKIESQNSKIQYLENELSNERVLKASDETLAETLSILNAQRENNERLHEILKQSMKANDSLVKFDSRKVPKQKLDNLWQKYKTDHETWFARITEAVFGRKYCLTHAPVAKGGMKSMNRQVFNAIKEYAQKKLNKDQMSEESLVKILAYWRSTRWKEEEKERKEDVEYISDGEGQSNETIENVTDGNSAQLESPVITKDTAAVIFDCDTEKYEYEDDTEEYDSDRTEQYCDSEKEKHESDNEKSDATELYVSEEESDEF